MRTLPRLPEATRAAFLAAARAYVGVRWRHLGRSQKGVDCIGLVIAALRDCGVAVDSPPTYTREPDGTLRDGLIERLGEPVTDWRAGDVVLMRWNTLNGPHCHVGILGTNRGEWTLLHAYLAEQRVVEHRLDGHWPRRIADVFSLTGGAA